MTVLVAYASAHGSTAQIARRIGSRLTQEGHPVEVRSVDEVDDLEGYDAVVLGGAIHSQAWLPEATAFADRHAAELSSRPLWMFTVGTVGDTSSALGARMTAMARKADPTPQDVASIRQRLHARGCRAFAGVVVKDDWPRLGRLTFRAMGGSFGDHRDWDDIDRWASGITRELLAA